MLTQPQLGRLLPHQGAMCLLAGVLEWSDAHLVAWADSHLDPANPLRRAGRLAALCGAEYAMQAAALHGALLAGAPQPGRLAALRLDTIAADRLDRPSLPRLHIEATREHADPRGHIYRFALRDSRGNGPLLLAGTATIVLAP